MVNDAATPGAAREAQGQLWAQWPLVVVGLLIAYLPMWVPSLASGLGIDMPGEGPASAIWVNWTAVVLLLGYVFIIERQGLSSLLMVRPRPGDIEWAFYFFGAFMTYSWVLSLIREQPSNEGTETIVAMPLLAVIALVITAGITEEILFRAYPIERISTLTGHRWIGALISLAIFITPHLTFFSLDWLIYQGPGTLAIYALYLWRRNLYACMTLHILINAPILIPTILGA